MHNVYKTVINNSMRHSVYKYEILQLYIFPILQKMLQLNERSPLWSEMCPSAKGAVLLYQRVMPDY